MTIIDFLIPIIVLTVLASMIYYFKRVKSNESFTSGDQNFNFFKKQINIGKNLFIGFNTKDESEKQLTMLKDAKMRFQDKMKEVNPGSNSIILKGQPSSGSDEKKYVNNICLGYNTGKIAPNYCINHSNLKKFEYENTGIPIYRDAGGRQIIYGNENEPQRHSKICFHDRRRGETLVENMSTVKPNAPPAEHCIEAKDFDKINGKKAVKLKVKQGNSYKTLNPTNVEYGPWPGFGNTVVRTFFMTDDDYKKLREDYLPASLTCYKPLPGKSNHPHHIHPAHTPWQAKGSFYLSPIENDHGEYSHIHA